MDFFTQFFTANTEMATISEIFIILFGTFFLSLLIAFVYKQTYRGHKYNDGFVGTLVTLAVLIAMVMLIVGSNVAGAFTMMGALSIIRFRNSLKDTRDIGFIFFAIAIGMAMGTKMFLYAVVGTPIILLIFYIIDKFSLFKGEVTKTKLLKIQIDENQDFWKIFNEIFEKNLKYFSLSGVIPLKINNENGEIGNIFEVSFYIIHDEKLDFQKFFQEIKNKNNHRDISLVTIS